MRNKFANLCMILGAALVIAALLLFRMNRQEDADAGSAAMEVLPDVVACIEERTALLSASTAAPTPEPIPETTPEAATESTPGTGLLTETLTEVVPDDAPQPTPAPQSESAPAPDSASTPQPAPESTPAAKPTDKPGYVNPYDKNMTVVTIKGYDYVGYIAIPRINIELPVMDDWSYPKLRKSPCRYTGSTKTDDLVIFAHNYSRHFGRLYKLSPGDEIIFTDMNGVITRYRVITTETVSPYSVAEVTSGEYDLTLFTCTYGGRSRVTVRADRA